MSELTAGPIFLIYYSEILCPTHCLGYSRSFSLWNNRKLPKSLERSLELLQSSTVELNCFLIHDMSWVFKLLVINIIPGMTFIICLVVCPAIEPKASPFSDQSTCPSDQSH